MYRGDRQLPWLLGKVFNRSDMEFNRMQDDLRSKIEYVEATLHEIGFDR